MEIWTQGVAILGNVVFLAGLFILAYNVIVAFSSLNSQNAEAKNHAGLGMAAGAGVMLVGKTLIPMIATSINIS